MAQVVSSDKVEVIRRGGAVFVRRGKRYYRLDCSTSTVSHAQRLARISSGGGFSGLTSLIVGWAGGRGYGVFAEIHPSESAGGGRTHKAPPGGWPRKRVPLLLPPPQRVWYRRDRVGRMRRISRDR